MATQRIMRERACAQCGAAPISGYKFCSDGCYQKNLYARRAVRAGFHLENRERVAACAAKKRERVGRRCPECAVIHALKRRQFCSESCRVTAHLRIADSRKVKTEPRKCAECAKMFKPRSATGVFCSHKCGRARYWRESNNIRRARLRSALVERFDPFEVFDRDGWRCHMCGAGTPKRLRGTCEDRAPELDHIVPLAAGGEHSKLNTACSCRRCNLQKADKPMGQMLLIG
jgi:hypothetical protein